MPARKSKAGARKPEAGARKSKAAARRAPSLTPPESSSAARRRRAQLAKGRAQRAARRGASSSKPAAGKRSSTRRPSARASGSSGDLRRLFQDLSAGPGAVDTQGRQTASPGALQRLVQSTSSPQGPPPGFPSSISSGEPRAPSGRPALSADQPLDVMSSSPSPISPNPEFSPLPRRSAPRRRRSAPRRRLATRSTPRRRRPARRSSRKAAAAAAAARRRRNRSAGASPLPSPLAQRAVVDIQQAKEDLRRTRVAVAFLRAAIKRVAAGQAELEASRKQISKEAAVVRVPSARLGARSSPERVQEVAARAAEVGAVVDDLAARTQELEESVAAAGEGMSPEQLAAMTPPRKRRVLRKHVPKGSPPRRTGQRCPIGLRVGPGKRCYTKEELNLMGRLKRRVRACKDMRRLKHSAEKRFRRKLPKSVRESLDMTVAGGKKKKAHKVAHKVARKAVRKVARRAARR